MTEHTTLRRDIARFQAPSPAAGGWQIFTSFGGFLATCAAMYALTHVSFWLAPLLAPLAAGFLVRIFIIQHDCGHLAFFRSRRANDAVGLACSILTLAPYASWRRQHAGHHGVWNDLDRRQSGADIYSFCLTVKEYRALGRWRRMWYRLTRHPLVANILLPPFIFILLYRFPFDMPKSWRAERRMVHVTTLALVTLFGGLGLLLGFDRVAAVQVPVMIFAAIAGVWLFSVQHRGENIRWVRRETWDSTTAALHSSSHLRLPKILQWFTGNIGLHHIHHLNARVPNYRLQDCQDAVPRLNETPPMSLGAGLRALRHILWDEDRGRMVTTREAIRPATA